MPNPSASASPIISSNKSQTKDFQYVFFVSNEHSMLSSQALLDVDENVQQTDTIDINEDKKQYPTHLKLKSREQGLGSL